MSNTKAYLIAGLMAACGLAFLLYWSLTGESLRVFSVGELLQASSRLEPAPEQEFRRVQVYGRVVFAGSGKPLQLTLADWDNPQLTMQVLLNSGYNGPATSALKPGQDVFVTGRLLQGSPLFAADELTATCPAKYESKRPAQANP